MKILLPMIIMVLYISCVGKHEKVNSEKPIENQDVLLKTNAKDNLYLDGSSQKYSELLSILDKKYEKADYLLVAELNPGRDKIIEDFRNYYSLGLKHHNSKEYENAIDNYILACKTFTFMIAYYQLGLCLMDIEDYENAEKSFNKALEAKYFYSLVEDFYTFDNNGQKREAYFIYYNIACIKSFQNDIIASYDSLCEALYCGYPYIEHIRGDQDLHNLFTYNNGIYRKLIEEIYNAGSNNTVAGKGFKMAWGGAPLEYYFVDHRKVICFSGGVAGGPSSGGDPSGWWEGEYEIRNYLIMVRNIKYYYEETIRDELYNMGIKRIEDTDAYREIPVDSYLEDFPYGY